MPLYFAAATFVFLVCLAFFVRDGIDLAEVRDVLWNYLAIDHYERLVLAQGWPLQRYSQWLAHAMTSAICR